ncbi:MAG: hypothetical protein Q8P12_02215, partial [bacterium]|nr:hypothetical protein [bacterium]
SDAVLVQLSYTFLYPFAILSAYSLLRVAFEVLGNPAWTKWTLLPVVGVIGTTLVLNFVFFSPAYVRTMGPIFNWSEGTAPWVQMLNTAFLALLVGGDAALFAWGGMKAKTPFLRLRAFLIAGGLVFVLLGLFFSYTLVFFVPQGFQVSLIVLAGAAALAGLALMLLGVYYKKEQEPFPTK